MVETLWHLILCALKAFAARVFAFLYTIDMKVMNLGLLFFFFPKVRACANSTEVKFKSTMFVTPWTERRFVLVDLYQVSQIPPKNF